MEKKFDDGKVSVTYYPERTAGWDGYIEDEAGNWILYFVINGKAEFFPKRQTSGAVVGQGVVSQPR